MNSSLLYTNARLPVPILRNDLQLAPVHQSGISYVLFVDPIGLVPHDLLIPSDFLSILNLFNGVTTLQEIYQKHLKKSDIPLETLLQFTTELDENRVLYSPYLKAYKKESIEKFEQSDVRIASCAGSCYPVNKEELKVFLDDKFLINDNSSDSKIKAIYAPHIDYRVGLDTYIKAYSRIKDHKPTKIVIVGTSHNSGYYPQTYRNLPFVLSRKKFNTPLGTTQIWREAYAKLEAHTGIEFGISTNDRAHQFEHSIELHVILCQYLFGHEIEILPILVSSFDEYLYFNKGNQATQINNMAKLLKSLDEDGVLWLISGDQTHFGRKFGDAISATYLMKETEQFDAKYLEFASKNDTTSIFQLMMEEDDKYRVCGFSPLFLFLKAFKFLEGELLERKVWHEVETESAVSFASIIYK